MLKKAKKRVQKKGNPDGSSFKFQFIIHVHSVEFTIADKKWTPGKLILEWKRNARLASTQGAKITAKGDLQMASFGGEEISMLGTLTRDEDQFDPKEYKFSFEDIRDKKSKKTLANVSIDLSPYASLTGATYDKAFDLDVMSVKIGTAKMHVTISSRLISQGNRDDDDMSMMSSVSTTSMHPEDNQALNSSDSENEGENKPRKSQDNPEKPADPRDRDERVNELLQKIIYLEYELSSAITAKQNSQDEAEREIEHLKTKMKIDMERKEIAMESLSRAKIEAEQEANLLAAKLDKERERNAEQIKTLREELLAAKSAGAPSNQTDLLESEKKSWDAERKELEKQLQELRQQQQKKEEAFRQELEQLRKENASLEALRSSASASTHFEASLKEKDEEIRQLQVELKSSQKKAGEQEQKVQALEHKLSNLTLDLESSQKSFASEKANLEREKLTLRASLDESLSKQGDWEKKEKKLQGKIDSLEEKVTQLSSSQQQTSSSETDALHNRIMELESELESITETHSLKNKELQTLVNSLKMKSHDEEARASKELTALKKETGSLKEQIEGLRQDLKEARESSASSENQQLLDLQKQTKNAQNEASELRKKYERLNGMYEAQEKIISDLKKQPTEKVEMASRSSEDAETFRTQMAKLNEELGEITNQLIIAKLGLAEGQFMFEKMKQSKKDTAKQLAAEKLKSLELRKKLTQFEVKTATKN